MKAWLTKLYQIIRYGAVQEPFPDWSKVKVVGLYDGPSKQFGAFNRETREIVIFEGYTLTERQLAWIREKAEHTQMARIIAPMFLQRHPKEYPQEHSSR